MWSRSTASATNVVTSHASPPPNPRLRQASGNGVRIPAFNKPSALANCRCAPDRRNIARNRCPILRIAPRLQTTSRRRLGSSIWARMTSPLPDCLRTS